MTTTGPSPAELEALQMLGAATLYHGQGERGAIDPAIRPIGLFAEGTKLAGPALTVDIPAGDNLAFHLALGRAERGSVLVVDAKGNVEVAVAGELMAVAAQHRGVAGMVVDGAVRDADELFRLRFPVFARGLSIRGPTKDAFGTVGEPVVVGGTRIATGDLIVADADGVVVLERASWRTTFERATARQQRELSVRQALEQGRTTIDALELRAALERHGMA